MYWSEHNNSKMEKKRYDYSDSLQPFLLECHYGAVLIRLRGMGGIPKPSSCIKFCTVA